MSQGTDGREGFEVLEESRADAEVATRPEADGTDDPYLRRLAEGVVHPEDAIPNTTEIATTAEPRTKVYHVEDDARELTVVIDDRGLLRALSVGAKEGSVPLSGMEASMYSLLESICRGQSIQEAAEHGVARTESWIRGTGTRPVAGVVQPENASPIFRRPLDLLRRIHQSWSERTARGVEQSQRRMTLATSWSTLDETTRRDRTSRRISEFAERRGVQSAALPLVAIRGRRVTIGTDRSAIEAAGSQPSDFLFELETELRTTLDPDIEVLSAPKRDRNRKRQKLRGFDPSAGTS